MILEVFAGVFAANVVSKVLDRPVNSGGPVGKSWDEIEADRKWSEEYEEWSQTHKQGEFGNPIEFEFEKHLPKNGEFK
jgi:hypothetical protein